MEERRTWELSPGSARASPSRVLTLSHPGGGQMRLQEAGWWVQEGRGPETDPQSQCRESVFQRLLGCHVTRGSETV